MAGTGKWSDLAPRVISAIILSLVGLGVVWAGGWWFFGFAVLLAGVMIWELSRMVDPENVVWTIISAGLAIFSILIYSYFPNYGLVTLLIVPVFGLVLFPKGRFTFSLYSLAILFAVLQLIYMRQHSGIHMLLWLVLVIVATDTMGYFAGKALGGAKFWPAISPKKTWSGTVAGWAAAAVVGFCYIIFAQQSWIMVPISVLISFAGQMGDIAESAIKRKVGVKDSSFLIPGHGGFLDRFDALIGAALVLFLLRMAAEFAS